MLKATNPLVRRFHLHALEEQQRAFEARNRRVRDEHFASARWWFKLAESFDFAIRLTPLDAPQLPDEPIPRHPACPGCIEPMRLVEIQSSSGQLECRFECNACGEKVTFTRTDH